MTTIITFIIIFGILVIVHEFGHYYFAKRSGILVREFSVGMGPKLFAHRKNGTTYTLRLLPLGGYVRMAGMQDDDAEIKPGTMVSLSLTDDDKIQRINLSEKVEMVDSLPFQVAVSDLEKELYLEGYQNGDESELKRFSVLHDATIIEEDGTEVQIAPEDVQFQSASLLNRIMTNFAGPMNNFILGIIAFILFAALSGGVVTSISNKVQVQDNSIAQKAGVRSGDHIIKINGTTTKDFNAAAAIVQKNPGKKITVTVKRETTTKTYSMVPKTNHESRQTYGTIGVVGKPVYDHSVLGMVKYGFTQSWDSASLIFRTLGSFFTGGFSLNKLSGPVGIYTMTQSFASQGFAAIIYFLALLSINLGIMNLIPIPALDGGKLIMNIIEGIRGKPISPEKEGLVTIIGAGFLVVLMVLVTWNDIAQLFMK